MNTSLNTQAWAQDIIEKPFVGNDWVLNSTDFSDKVGNNYVNVPNAGALPNVVKSRDYSAGGATGSMRVDTNIQFALADYSTDVVPLPASDEYAISYNKRASVNLGMRNAISNVASANILNSWSATAPQIAFSGSATVAGYAPDGSGTRKAIVLADVRALKKKMDKAGLPKEDRYLLLNTDMISDLLQDTNISEAQKMGLATMQEGTINGEPNKQGRLQGFNVVEVLNLPVFSSDGATIRSIGVDGLPTGVISTDRYGAICYHKSCVARAVGDVTVIEAPDARYHGDVLSAVMFAGGKQIASTGVFVALQG